MKLKTVTDWIKVNPWKTAAATLFAGMIMLIALTLFGIGIWWYTTTTDSPTPVAEPTTSTVTPTTTDPAAPLPKEGDVVIALMKAIKEDTDDIRRNRTADQRPLLGAGSAPAKAMSVSSGDPVTPAATPSPATHPSLELPTGSDWSGEILDLTEERTGIVRAIADGVGNLKTFHDCRRFELWPSQAVVISRKTDGEQINFAYSLINKSDKYLVAYLKSDGSWSRGFLHSGEGPESFDAEVQDATKFLIFPHPTMTKSVSVEARYFYN